MLRHVLLAAVITGLVAGQSACSGSDPANGDGDDPGPTPTPEAVPTYGYRIVNVFPHDPGAWTQGLVYADGYLYEGTGGGVRLGSHEALSSLRKVELETGIVVAQTTLDERFFGEGIALFGGRFYQLTWKSQTGFLYERDGFARVGEFTYPTEGWGLTHDGDVLIMSDGSSLLYRRDPTTFAELGRVDVRHEERSVGDLNELEWVEGEVWANVWQTDIVARINPLTGDVVGWIDLRGLLTASERQQTDVLNGIAYDAKGQRLFVTGKLWPSLFEVELTGP